MSISDGAIIKAGRIFIKAGRARPDPVLEQIRTKGYNLTAAEETSYLVTEPWERI
jgi:hypothetical protein